MQVWGHMQMPNDQDTIATEGVDERQPTRAKPVGSHPQRTESRCQRGSTSNK